MTTILILLCNTVNLVLEQIVQFVDTALLLVSTAPKQKFAVVDVLACPNARYCGQVNSINDHHGCFLAAWKSSSLVTPS